jgi:hypothetical protein
MLCLMSRKDDHWGNASTDSFFGSLKTKLMEDEPFETRQAGRTALFRFIEGFYNRARRHSAIGDKAATKPQPRGLQAVARSRSSLKQGKVTTNMAAPTAGHPKASGCGPPSRTGTGRPRLSSRACVTPA